jgi:hypothetical protein
MRSSLRKASLIVIFPSIAAKDCSLNAAAIYAFPENSSSGVQLLKPARALIKIAGINLIPFFIAFRVFFAS